MRQAGPKFARIVPTVSQESITNTQTNGREFCKLKLSIAINRFCAIARNGRMKTARYTFLAQA
jgi:hypothetical protein